MMNPRLAATDMRPKLALRSSSLVMSARYALATETLPPVSPSSARPRSSTTSGNGERERAEHGGIHLCQRADRQGQRDQEDSHDISVPIWLSSRIFLRPKRSDQRPNIGAPISWNAEHVAPITPYVSALPPSRTWPIWRKA